MPQASISATKNKYRPEIDGLRAFAVVAVIINHFNKDILPGGYLGVDIFFVISGYVITSSLFGRPSKDFKDFISGFYERRIKRLVPALSAFVLITSIAICLFNPSPDLSLRTGLTSLFGFSNLYLLKQSTDYFAQPTKLNVFTHTWSLGVEEQFYILFPFLIWFSGFGRQTKNGARDLFLVVGALTIASLIGFIYLYPTNQPAAYFLMPSRFWEMAAGCLIFIGFQKRASVEQLLEKVPPLLVMALIVGVMYLPISFAAASTIAVVALSSVLIASLKKQTAAFEVFTNPKVVYIGLISYSLYLWHWSVLSISRWTIGIHWWSVPFQVVLMLGLAVASYRWIETPLRTGTWYGKRWKTLVFGGGVLVMVSGGLVALGKPLKGEIYLGSNGSGTRNAITGKSCNIYDDFKKAQNLDLCGSTPQNNSKTMFILGDSHGNQYKNAMSHLAQSTSIDYRIVWGDSCLFPASHVRLGGKECFDKQEAIENKVLDKVVAGDIVIVVNALWGHFHPNKGYSMFKGEKLSREGALKKFEFAFKRFADSMTRKGVIVVFYTDGVRFPDHPTGSLCREEWFRTSIPSSCYASKSAHQKLIDIRFSWLNEWENNYDKFVWHASKYQSNCNSNKCLGGDYNDSSHFTDAEAELVLERFLTEKKLFLNAEKN